MRSMRHLGRVPVAGASAEAEVRRVIDVPVREMRSLLAYDRAKRPRGRIPRIAGRLSSTLLRRDVASGVVGRLSVTG